MSFICLVRFRHCSDNGTCRVTDGRAGEQGQSEKNSDFYKFPVSLRITDQIKNISTNLPWEACLVL
jgi:hypothetical protein